MEPLPHHTQHPEQDTKASRLTHTVLHAAHLLPTQGPIGVFVHHNTLHALQDLPFEQAVVKAAALHGAEPFLPEETYRDALKKGRITQEDIQTVLSEEPDRDILPSGLTRRTLRETLLVHGPRRVNGLNIQWLLEECGLNQTFRSDLPSASAQRLENDTPQALWDACLNRLNPQDHTPKRQSPRRPAEAVARSLGIHLDDIVHPPLIRLTGAYLDQGIAYWPMPDREKGLLECSRNIMSRSPAVFPNHLDGMKHEFERQSRLSLNPTEVVLEMLDRLGVDEDHWDAFLTAELLALPGWAGMVHMLENDPSLAPHDRVRCSIMEFLALRLSYTAVALENVCGKANEWQLLAATGATHHPLAPIARCFDTAQLLGIPSHELLSLPQPTFHLLAAEIAAFDETERRRILHLAYELHHERAILNPLLRHRRSVANPSRTRRPSAQVICCIDEREESFRRAIEEIDVTVDTVGAAGFFGMAIDYAGIDDPSGVSLCPVVVKPGHQVRERAVPDSASTLGFRTRLRRIWAVLARNGSISSKTLVRGWFSTACLGFFSVFPLLFRVLTPLAYSKITASLNRLFLPIPKTELAFMRQDKESRDATTGLLEGFSTTEQADRVAAVLGPAGLHADHARVVVVLGHGSTSLNNPYESAYCCGACGGRTGAPNARLFALIANREEVRKELASRGMNIPSDTWFIGGYHDTCSENVELFDLDLLPSSHREDLERIRVTLDSAREKNALERCRRFPIAANKRTNRSALRHVQERSEHIGEPRPEYGHCTNAVAIVGRRETTRGLFLDRRAFLISYDAQLDPSDQGLARTLGAVIPVCGGISLEYYFSTVDNERYGSGTKLPHNISGLLGVMNGYQGDLRTGLPVQTVEIHEPVRILFVVESTPDRVLKTIRANPELSQFLFNQWIRMATLDPVDGHIEVFRNGTFVPFKEAEDFQIPSHPTSQSYYQGHLEHLPPAQIRPPSQNHAA
jgi:uncharacterized protein YbcC (UPF0753/DUF2309 family)